MNITGEPYVAHRLHFAPPENTKFVVTPVWNVKSESGGHVDAYTVIRAQPPLLWLSPIVLVRIFLFFFSLSFPELTNMCQLRPVDLRTEGYKTTIGPDNFYDLKRNKQNPLIALNNVPLGRPSTVSGPDCHTRENANYVTSLMPLLEEDLCQRSPQ